MLRVRRGGKELVMNFSDQTVDDVPAWTGTVVRCDGLAG